MTDALQWLLALARTDNPSLPGLQVQQWALRVEWALVLGWVGMVLARSLGHSLEARVRLRWMGGAAATLGAAVLLLPGEWTPAYWLGLAFQWPSLLTVALCTLFLWRGLMPSQAAAPSTAPAPMGVWVLLLVLGWLLLLDTFALLPIHLYAWGFSPLALLLPAALAFALLLLPRSGTAGAELGLCLLAVLLLHVFTRLPTGNVWDALLDPWLWVVLHGVCVRRWRARSH